MVIVTLKDGTTYWVDTNNTNAAKSTVDYKLRQRLDFRSILSASQIDAVLDQNSKYYNPATAYDGLALKCKTGWSYKWSETSCAEFR